MPRAKKVELDTIAPDKRIIKVPQVEPSKTEVAESVEELDAKISEALSNSKTEFAVHAEDGGLIRIYSLAKQGENAEALAHQYAAKIGGKVL
jgi:hypothetical protein